MGLIAKVSKSLDGHKGHIDNPEAVVRVRGGLVGCGGGSVVGSGATLGAETTVFEVLANSSMVELARMLARKTRLVSACLMEDPTKETA